MKIETDVLVIGGGLTGAGVLRDLALRGVDALLLERKDINAGASGANHGLLHSGARYAVTDPESARECAQENRVLKWVAAGCVDDCGGLFVGLAGDDETYAETLLSAAAAAGIEARPADLREVREQEPLISPDLAFAVEVPDASINPFAATLANLADARSRGARLMLHTEVTALRVERGRVVTVTCVNAQTGEKHEVHPQQVVSAAGPWVDRIAAMAGAEVKIAYSKGSLLISNSRLVGRVVNRCRPPSDGDIIVPGESVTITGTNSIRVGSLDHLTTSAAEVDALVGEAARMVPAMARARYIRAYAGVRPMVLVGGAARSDRGLSRTFTVFDHEEHGLHNLATITGGKLTTYRLMAERVTDLVCRRLDVTAPCVTALRPLPGSAHGAHLDPADRLRRLAAPPPGGEVLCECEMVSRDRVLDLAASLQAAGHPVGLNALRLRTRLGMGACQGGFCGYRTVGALHQAGVLGHDQGNELLTTFLERRWGGIKPVLWGEQLRQEQLLEALYCGTLNIDGNL